MVEPVPTFNSTRVTNTPNMGIVEAGGLRASAAGFSQAAKSISDIADYANKKADEQMAFRVERDASEAVRNGGLDPATLKDPVTLADRIYRQSAINTYSIKLEQNVEDNLNRMFLENRYNPAGFSAKAKGFLNGTISKLPFEMKNAVEKSAGSMIAQKTFSLQQQVQAKVLAENEAVEKDALEKLSADIVNASGRGDAALVETNIQKIRSVIGNSQRFLTPEAKASAVADVERDIGAKVVSVGLMRGQINQQQARESLEKLGVAITPGVQEQLYAAEFVDINYQARLLGQQKEAQSRAVEAINEQLWTQVDAASQNGALDFTTTERIVQETQERMRAAGVSSEDVFAVRAKVLKAVQGAQIDNFDVVDGVNSLVNQGLYDEAKGFLNNARGEGGVTAATYNTLTAKINEEKSTIMSSPIIKMYMQDFTQYAPNAGRTIDPAMAGTDIARSIRMDDEKVNAQKNLILQMNAEGKTPQEIVDILESNNRANRPSIPPVQKMKYTVPGTPENNKAREIITSDNFRIETFGADGRSVTYSAKDKKTPEYMREILAGPTTKENYRDRLKLMAVANKAALDNNKPIPYPPNVMRDILNAYQ